MTGQLRDCRRKENVFILISEQGSLNFHFALGPTSYGAGSASRLGIGHQFWSFRTFDCQTKVYSSHNRHFTLYFEAFCLPSSSPRQKRTDPKYVPEFYEVGPEQGSVIYPDVSESHVSRPFV